jgi:hypothetical protein
MLDLWQVLSRVWRRLFRQVPTAKRAADRTGGEASRARFWAELREGQREAEARSTRQRS